MNDSTTQPAPAAIEPIDRFAGPYAFLWNFHPSAVELGDRDYPTVEHAFQAAKTDDPRIRAEIGAADTPGQAKRLGRKLALRPGWDDQRDGVMRRLVQQKFIRHHDLGAALAGTDPRPLIEGNSWGDRYWGVCDGEGENRLGQILMEVRAQLADEEDPEDEDEVIVGYDLRLYLHVQVDGQRIARAVLDPSTACDPTLVVGDPAVASEAIAVCEDDAAQWPSWEFA